MVYFKENNTGITINKVCTVLFQLCVVADAIIGFDPKLYVVSKGVMFAFFVIMIIKLLWCNNIQFGHAVVFPVLFMIVTALSCLWAVYPEPAMSRFTTQIQLYILFFFTYFLFTNEVIDVKRYFDALYIAGIGMVAFALYRYGLNGIIQGLNEGNRLGRVISNENVFGMVFSKASLVAYYYFLKAKNKPIRIIHIMLVVVFTFFAFTSGSKKAFLMIVVGIIGINLLENGISKIWKTLMASLLAIGGLILILQMPLFSTMNQRIMDFFSGNKDSSELVRSKMIDLSMQLFYEKPILGHGFNNFGMISGLGAYSHNNLTEILVSTGIVGFVIFYIPYILMIRWGWREGIKQKNYIAMLLFILSLIYLVFGYGMVEYYDKEYWLFLGVMVACIDNGTIMIERKMIDA